ncbi:hypothetical protein COLO4_22217 [Corchorus olitorius]|uniref:Myb-like domain-containing protein n=1 Tax=Corchorus olitorius TaxID=93759 RepID=A0A1R3INE8_9ROSI|nr:hypothetical protein COLO4_22217 [Corchorus olitorius]
MVHKRPFSEDGTIEVPNKHSRQAEHSNELGFSSESFLPEDDSIVSETSGEGRFINANTKCDEKLANAIGTQHSGSAEDFEASAHGCITISSLGTRSTGEGDSWPEEPLHIPSYAECFRSKRPGRTLPRWDDIYSILLECPPRKPVFVGPNYQADIPEWDSQVAKSTLNDTDASAAVAYETILMGTCVIPMPALESSAYDDKVGSGRCDCSCEDKDSVRCVRQHIMEAKEELRKYLGHEKFVELGFCEMGELVSETWSEEEEQLFHKVVFSNPVSLGRNFWDSLAFVFPYRTKEEIVRYYFNVFMLRKRSEQNRCESMSIDSDNDEWQGTDDSGINEAGFSDEDDDSVVESPVGQEGFDHHNRETGMCVYDEDETCDNHNVDYGSGADATKLSETYSEKLFSNYGSEPATQLHGQTPKDAQQQEEEEEVQDDSCTSSDTGAASQETQVNTHNSSDQWQGHSNGLSNGGNHGYVSESCDTKVWDAGYPTCQKNKIDFLPTCSMIEEVFGDGS